jgi:hypothetical protein
MKVSNDGSTMNITYKEENSKCYSFDLECPKGPWLKA